MGHWESRAFTKIVLQMSWESKDCFRFFQSDQKVTRYCYGLYMNFIELFIHFNHRIKFIGIFFKINYN